MGDEVENGGSGSGDDSVGVQNRERGWAKRSLEVIIGGVIGGVVGAMIFAKAHTHIEVPETWSVPVVVGQEIEDSQYDQDQKPTFYRVDNINTAVYFDDNLAMGMEAHVVAVGDEDLEMERMVVMGDYSSFYFPEELLSKDRQYQIYAVDRDGNNSWKKTVYVLDGRLFDENPFGPSLENDVSLAAKNISVVIRPIENSQYDLGQKPTFKMVDNINTAVYFDDNLAMGMSAFLVSGKEDLELEPFSVSEKASYSTFKFPKELLSKDGQYQIYAVDRDGNNSGEKTIYVLDGRLFGENPYGS